MRGIFVTLTIAGVCFGISTAQAQSVQQTQDAKWLLERLSGIKWASNAPVIKEMALKIANGDRQGAARLATAQPSFINLTVKQMAAKMSSREEIITAPLNDFVATIMGVVRDGTDARELLTGNFYYRGDAAQASAQGKDMSGIMNESIYILVQDRHYRELDVPNLDLSKILVRQEGQNIVTALESVEGVYPTIPNPDPAGLLTTKGWMAAHAFAGTNRRLVEFTFREFMCLPIEQVADAASSDSRVGRDIDRFPGGDHVKYQTSCKACHTVMDGFRGAFSAFDFANGVVKHAMSNGLKNARPAQTNGVMNKLNQNAQVYPGGFITTNDSFVNHANRGANAEILGWRNADHSPAVLNDLMPGMGVKQFGTLISNSTRFSACMAQRVFETVCRRTLSTSEQKTLINNLGAQFESASYNMKRLFELVAIHPSCRM